MNHSMVCSDKLRATEVSCEEHRTPTCTLKSEVGLAAREALHSS